MSTFVKPPAPGEGIKWENLKGALLLVEPISVEVGVKTVHGETDAVRANVVVIDGPGADDTYNDALIFPKVMKGQAKAALGQKILSRLGQGNAKTGQSAPWVLQDPSEDDEELYDKWLAAQSKPIDPPEPPF